MKTSKPIPLYSPFEKGGRSIVPHHLFSFLSKGWISTVIVLAFTVLIASTASADIDLKRMKRDLTIQESVLDRFFETSERSTTGLYVENYGIVLVSQALKPNRSRVGDKIHVRIVKPDSAEYLPTGTRFRSIHAEGGNETNNKTRIAEFLGTYGDAVGQLDNNDRITILMPAPKRSITVNIEAAPPKVDYRVVNTDSTDIDTVRVEKRIYRTPSRSSQHNEARQAFLNATAVHSNKKGVHGETFKFSLNEDGDLHQEDNTSLFIATVTKRDIDAYSRGKIDLQTFQSRITFQEQNRESTRDKKIDIMADILTSALKQDNDLHILNPAKSSGIYQKGIGALFLVSQEADLSWVEQEEENKPLETLKTTIIETIADYGPTLRDLSSKESIIVHANLNPSDNLKHLVRIVRINAKDNTTNVTKPQHPDRLIFRVSKRDIDAYASKKIDLETFRKRVEITEM